eukprot:Hpha_TRINITY_DN15282_c4_g16::TRINITY_DN15282_c4_g16_i1::g.66730::m.66730
MYPISSTSFVIVKMHPGILFLIQWQVCDTAGLIWNPEASGWGRWAAWWWGVCCGVCPGVQLSSGGMCAMAVSVDAKLGGPLYPSEKVDPVKLCCAGGQAYCPEGTR